MRKTFIITNMMVIVLYFLPEIVKPVTLSTYIGLGHTIDLKTAFTVIIFFNLLDVITICMMMIYRNPFVKPHSSLPFVLSLWSPSDV